MNDEFCTLPAGQWQQTLVVQKSRFIAFAARVDSAAAAQDFIKAVALPDATHHCYAYLTPDGQKSNDNGEPAGTAGKPILQAIQASNLTHVVVVVERYFGGIKLGTGGLARAYGQAAAQVLTMIPPVRVRACHVLHFISDYEQQSALTQLVQKYQGQSQLTYQDKVQWQVQIPVPQSENFVAALPDIMHKEPTLTIDPQVAWVEFSTEPHMHG